MRLADVVPKEYAAKIIGWIVAGLFLLSLLALPKVIPSIVDPPLYAKGAIIVIALGGGIGCIFKGLVSTGISDNRKYSAKERK